METSTRMHPLTAIAAVSVTLFSLAGIGAITGLIPTSHSQPEQMQAVKPADDPSKLAAAARPAETVPAVTGSKPADKPAVHKAAAKHTKPADQATKPVDGPVKTVKDPAPVVVAQNYPPPLNEPASRAEPVRPICYDCGVIESVREIEKKGEGSGVGAVAGGLAGGVLGHQTGAGRGKDVMTVLGAIGGAVAGHQIEKNVKKVKSYEIAIRFEDGTTRLINQDNPPAWRSGDRVRLVNGVISASN